MEEKLIRSIPLSNGLELHLLDGSKPLPGKRWLTRCIIRIDIPTDRFDPGMISGPSPTPEEVQAVLGDHVEFEVKRDRNFISDSDKPSVLTGMCDMFLEITLGYVSLPNFPAKCILGKYRQVSAARDMQARMGNMSSRQV